LIARYSASPPRCKAAVQPFLLAVFVSHGRFHALQLAAQPLLLVFLHLFHAVLPLLLITLAHLIAFLPLLLAEQPLLLAYFHAVLPLRLLHITLAHLLAFLLLLLAFLHFFLAEVGGPQISSANPQL
jgi:hypothetical protein